MPKASHSGNNGSVVPTPVGVNRGAPASRYLPRRRCPHACGGEPDQTEASLQLFPVVPTPVGVNHFIYSLL
ncbi:hypothetical protein [Parathermosynechococcus lividus]